MLQNAWSTRQSIPLAGQSVNPGEGRVVLLSFCLLWESVHRNARCVGMVFAAYFIWPSATQYCEPTFFLCFRFSFHLHFTHLAGTIKVKSRMAPLLCVPSCDVIELTDRASRVRRKLGSNTCLFLA